MSENNAERKYLVLEDQGAEDGLVLLGHFPASSADQACRHAAAGYAGAKLEAGVLLVAVPARHWNPRTYRGHTETRIVTS